MLEEELTRTLRSLCEDGACYLSPSDVDFKDPLPPEEFTNAYYTPQRHWSHVEMIRLIHGEMALHINGVWTRLSDGKMRIFLQGTVHTEHYLRRSQSYTLLWLTIVPRGIDIHYTGYSPDIGYYRSDRGGGLVRTVTSGDDKRRGRVRIGSPVSVNLWRCASEVSPSHPRFHYLLMESLDSSLRNSNFAIDADNQRTNVLQEIKEYLNEYYYKQLSINDLGAMTQFSAPYLNRLFRERYQLSLHDYLSQLRLSHAAVLLKDEPTMPIGKVAAAVGIPDQRYFSRCFRKEYGMTPGEYRERNVDSHFYPSGD